MNKNILFVAPHPDDETLGCGGVIYKHKNHGDNVYWLLMTDLSKQDNWSEDLINQRKVILNNVRKAYDFKQSYELDYPTTGLDKIPISDIVGSVSKIIKEIKPHTVYLNNYSDIHTDHEIVFKVVCSCTKYFRYP